MNFRELENLENRIASAESLPMSNYQKERLNEFLEKEGLKAKAKENPFIYFYEDVISSALSFDFRHMLGESYFKKASDDASSCLSMCNEFTRISTWLVPGWLQNALKFTDHIVLHYIQEFCREIPKKYPSVGLEKSRYLHISEKEGEISTAGFLLTELYNLRNNLEHRTITSPDGKQELISPNRNYIRKTVMKCYPDALKRILTTYRESHKAPE